MLRLSLVLSVLLVNLVQCNDNEVQHHENVTSTIMTHNFFHDSSLCPQPKFFPCSDHGRCVQDEHPCDDYTQCLNGNDETPFNKTLHQNSSEGIQCITKKLGKSCFLPMRYKCDGYGHCKGNADECDCSEGKFFKCMEGECILNTTVCDGVKNCTNGADEMPLPPNYNVSDTAHGIQCTTELNTQCLLPNQYVCDGVSHCKGHVDECFCERTTDFFKCSDGNCIMRELMCDGKNDCANGEDEHTVKRTSDVESNTTHFACQMTKKKEFCVLPLEFKCDGRSDCYYHEDECNDECSEEINQIYSKCNDGTCIKKEQMCNKKKDCKTAEDESAIPKNSVTDEHGLVYVDSQVVGLSCTLNKGKKYDQCLLPVEEICDGYASCHDNQDECHCNDTAINYPFRCTESGQGCLKVAHFCNKKDNCLNARDEMLFSDESDGFHCLTYSSRHGYRVCDLPFYHTCDGVNHCLNKEDEELCHNDDFLSPRSFKCFNQRKIIKRTQLCDGIIDCPDLSDECELCGEKLDICDMVCKNNDNDTCVETNEVCDGEYSVYVNGTDEKYCRMDSLSNPYRPLYGNAPIDDLLCCNNLIKCNRSLYNCSALFQCPTANTRTRDDVTEGFLFAPIYAYACDGIITCQYGEDECNNNCSMSPRQQIRCDFASRDYYQGVEICNGKFKGMDDEFFCDDLRVNCTDQERDPVSVHPSLVCNQIADCYDNTDEGNCSTETHFYCSKDPVMFLTRDKLCDGREDCLDGRDECQSCTQSPFSSDQRLISSVFLRVFVWVSGILSLLANMVAIILSLIEISRNRKNMKPMTVISKLHLLSLSGADLCVGIYLLLVAMADIAFAGVYCYKDKWWRSSHYCEAIGALGLFGSQASVFTLTMLTVHRLYTIATPFREHYIRSAIIRIAFIWAVAIAFATIPIATSAQDYFISKVAYNDTSLWTLFSRQDNSKFINQAYNISTGIQDLTDGKTELYSWGFIFDAMKNFNYTVERKYGYYSAHGVCLSNLYPDQNRDISWGYTTCIMIINFISFLLIGVSYVCIYRNVLETSKLRSTQAADQLQVLQKKISVIILTDFCCWMPICITCFIKLSGYEIPKEMYAITAIVILPINSAINPLIYSPVPDFIHDKIWKPTKNFTNTISTTVSKRYNRNAVTIGLKSRSAQRDYTVTSISQRTK